MKINFRILGKATLDIVAFPIISCTVILAFVWGILWLATIIGDLIFPVVFGTAVLAILGVSIYKNYGILMKKHDDEQRKILNELSE